MILQTLRLQFCSLAPAVEIERALELERGEGKEREGGADFLRRRTDAGERREEARRRARLKGKMGKHNGKSRKKGIQVGSALLRRKMGNGPSQNKRAADDAGSRHTTDSGGDFNTQSIVEMNDLDELMNMVGQE